ncbi:MAG: 1-acyl-sn-glycerol-3-phosphate acyltransferase [Clostridia bacterium]|nr:1-acyl-sn-glycerol-3-phosphate acyltransferase [Clostridia bacterium]
MNIKIKNITLDELQALPGVKKRQPKKPNILFKTLLKIITLPDVWATKFKLNKIGMERLGKNEPCLILMNHSSFFDLKLMVNAMYPKPMNIVTTIDGLVGQEWLLRNIGCMPTRKFVIDLGIIKDIKYCLTKLKSNVLMFPEAGYSFDGTSTVLPDSLGKLVKLLGAPLVSVIMNGSFARQPLYNQLHLRKVKIDADMKYLLSPEEIKNMSAEEINAIIRKEFSFDQFRWQQENNIKITEKNRADRLERVLYKCPHCLKEGEMVGLGTTLTCKACGKVYELTESGKILALEGDTEFDHVPNWYSWQRDCVKKELLNDEYHYEDFVDLYAVKDTKALYKLGDARLVQNKEGLTLYDLDGNVIFEQKPKYTYTLNADFFWYELDDIVCIGNMDVSYYCFPKNNKNVAKMRLVAEELYKIAMGK